ncbi:MAG: peptidase M29 [Pseudomonadota bacterium]
MLTDRVEAPWIDAFEAVFSLCKIARDETVVLLTETQSRPLNVHLAELALGRMQLNWAQIRVPTPPAGNGPIARSTGASQALNGHAWAVRALCEADVIIDLTLEGLMHAAQTAEILKSGARVQTISNEHPEALARTVPTQDLMAYAKDAVKRCRAAEAMQVRSEAGTDLSVAMAGAATVGVWGWTDRPGTLAHWPGGIVVSFPAAKSVTGRLAYQPGDMNLTFKRYFDSAVTFTVENDYITHIDGTGSDAALMRAYLDGFGEPEAFATSHVGWGFNPGARYEALTMYDARDTNCTELRAVAGNFLYSTGANEFAGRFTRGHFDLPMMGCDIALDGTAVVEAGRLL